MVIEMSSDRSPKNIKEANEMIERMTNEVKNSEEDLDYWRHDILLGIIKEIKRYRKYCKFELYSIEFREWLFSQEELQICGTYKDFIPEFNEQVIEKLIVGILSPFPFWTLVERLRSNLLFTPETADRRRPSIEELLHITNLLIILLDLEKGYCSRFFEIARLTCKHEEESPIYKTASRLIRKAKEILINLYNGEVECSFNLKLMQLRDSFASRCEKIKKRYPKLITRDVHLKLLSKNNFFYEFLNCRDQLAHMAFEFIRKREKERQQELEGKRTVEIRDALENEINALRPKILGKSINPETTQPKYRWSPVTGSQIINPYESKSIIYLLLHSPPREVVEYVKEKHLYQYLFRTPVEDDGLHVRLATDIIMEKREEFLRLVPTYEGKGFVM